MRRAILMFVVVGMLTLAISLPALTQEGGEYQGAAQYGAGETQYGQGVAEAGCDWYWGNKWSAAGEWEYWCWDPQQGWWYAISEDGNKKFVRMSGPGFLVGPV